jgi:zinc transporter 2
LKQEKHHSHKHGHSHSHGSNNGKGSKHLSHSHAEEEEQAEHAQKRARTALIAATLFTMVFMCVEIAGGYIAGSLAIMTDAAHLLTDVAAMCLSLFAMHWARKQATKHMTFGYHRAEILGALASIVTIWGLVAVLGYESIMRLVADARLVGEEVDGMIMTIIGVCGLFVNIIDALILRWGNAPHGHSHSHGGGGHGHGNENINVRSAFIHVLGDCLQSVGVIIAAAVIWIGNKMEFGSPRASKSWWNIADPIASLLFGFITLITTIRLCKHAVDVLMEKVPEGIDYELIMEELQNLPGVTDVHDLHIWSLTVGKISLSVHISSEQVVETLVAAQRICRTYNIKHTTIQVEPPSHPEIECKHNMH